MAAIVVTDKQPKYIGISVAINRKSTNDFPILVNKILALSAIVLPKFLLALINYGPNSVSNLGHYD